MKNRFIMINLCILISHSLLAQTKVGTSAVDFLGIGIGPNAIGMGSAVVSFQTGPSSMYWNPGIIGSQPKTEISFSQMNWLVGSKYNWLGASFAINDASAFGFQIAHINYGEEDVTTELAPTGTGDKWDAKEMFLALTYSQSLTDQFSIGTNLKYIRSQIYHEIAIAYALDFGLLYKTDWRGLRLGVSVSNFGSDIQYQGKDLFRSHDAEPNSSGNNGNIPAEIKTDSWPLPIFFKVGVSMEVYEDDLNKITNSIDATRQSNNSESINVGLQYSWSNMIFIRGGYKNLFVTDAIDNLAFGFGLKYLVGNYNMKFDVSYQKLKVFDSILNYSVSIEI